MNLIDQAKHIPHGVSVITDWLGSGAEIVSQEVAQARGDNCIKCPLNVAGNPFVGAAAAVIKQTIALKNRLQLRIKGEKCLGICEACGCVNKLKIWMPPGRVQQDTDADVFARLDPGCWIRKEAA